MSRTFTRAPVDRTTGTAMRISGFSKGNCQTRPTLAITTAAASRGSACFCHESVSISGFRQIRPSNEHSKVIFAHGWVLGVASDVRNTTVPGDIDLD